MEEMQHHSMSWIEVQFLKMAVDVLCSCRQTLMYTYVFAFYLLKNNQSIIFEVSSIAFCLSYATVRWCILWICCNFPSFIHNLQSTTSCLFNAQIIYLINEKQWYQPLIRLKYNLGDFLVCLKMNPHIQSKGKWNFMALWCFYNFVYNNTLTKLLIDKNWCCLFYTLPHCDIHLL